MKTVEEFVDKTLEEVREELIVAPGVMVLELIEKILNMGNLCKAWEIFEVEFVLEALDKEPTEIVKTRFRRKDKPSSLSVVLM